MEVRCREHYSAYGVSTDGPLHVDPAPDSIVHESLHALISKLLINRYRVAVAMLSGAVHFMCMRESVRLEIHLGYWKCEHFGEGLLA